MARLMLFLTRTRGVKRLHWTDWFSYSYLFLGVLLMFGPVVWMVMSSFKTETQLMEFPPNFLPYGQIERKIEGFENPLPLFLVKKGDYQGKILAQSRRVGILSHLVDPDDPDTLIKINVRDREPVKEFSLSLDNYSELFERFKFTTYLWNSIFITVVATLITLLTCSMAAFALSKYKFKGKLPALALIVGALMVPHTVTLVPLFLITKSLGLFNSLWGVILPAVASPTGVFLLRQYMLTIPDEILDAARMDKASEWKIYWRIILPLSMPALAVLCILSVMWRWNDFLWPLIVLFDSDKFTLQLALNSFQGQHDTQWSNLLAMTVLVLIPIATVFSFLQKYITTGTASSGIK
ncbi:MAG: ABC transporter permease [Alphaproteobacteria bacterium]|nr:MAG: ABC transporter permease [Alphaproteobacteria bacterium]